MKSAASLVDSTDSRPDYLWYYCLGHWQYYYSSSWQILFLGCLFESLDSDWSCHHSRELEEMLLIAGLNLIYCCFKKRCIEGLLEINLCLNSAYFVFITMFCLRLFAVVEAEVGKMISFCDDFGNWTKCFSCCPFPELNSWYEELLELLLLLAEMTPLAEVGVEGLEAMGRVLLEVWGLLLVALLLLNWVLLKLLMLICGCEVNLTMVELLACDDVTWLLLLLLLLLWVVGVWDWLGFELVAGLVWLAGIEEVELRRRICAELILIAVGGLRLFAFVMIWGDGL